MSQFLIELSKYVRQIHRGKIKVSHEISERPAAAEGRSEPGHWEGDTVAGKAAAAAC